MRLIVETEDIQEKALLVQKKTTPFTRKLLSELSTFDINVSQTATLPYNFRDIDYMFIVQDTYTEGEIRQIFEGKTKTLIITTEEKIFKEFGDLINRNSLQHVRVILIHEDETHSDIVERVLWFMLSSSTETALDVSSHLPPKAPSRKKSRRPKIKLTRTRIITAVVFMAIALHTLFILPLIGTTITLYTAGRALQDQRIVEAQTSVDQARKLFYITKATYALAKPGLQFLFLSIVPDNLISIQENSIELIDTGIRTIDNARTVATLILDENKDANQLEDVRRRVRALQKDVLTIQKSSQNIYERLDYNISSIQEARKDFEEVSGYLETSAQLTKHLDTILADNSQKDYIVYFYNNMEIRPGGGFIGSFAHITFRDYTLQKFEVYDVYDADGQLKTHVRPPAPIREYLDQPHWFLRDSNFSPDFELNAETAEYFLERELSLGDFDGAVGITTTALTYILESFGDVYIPDFEQTINANNFYFVTQSQTETDFFPGSTQKKSFLSAVGRTLLFKLEEADPVRLGLAAKRSLDEKHIVMLSQDPAIQADLDALGWSGKILNPQCIATTPNCVINHILPVDANLGVNKANYFVNKLMKLKTVIDNKGNVDNELSISFTNNSSPGVFPGGTYKNYFQLYVPHNASISSLDINGVKIKGYDISTTGLFKVVGVLIEIKPKETVVATISYRLSDTIKSGDNAYQIVLQKQIGAFSNDFSFEVLLPDDVLITDQNFKSVAKNNSVLYNSSLSTNKVFVIEFVKE